MLATLLHFQYDDMYARDAGVCIESHKVFTNMPSREGVTLDEFKDLAYRYNKRGVGCHCYVIANTYPGGGFRGAEKICSHKDYGSIYVDLDEAQGVCDAMNADFSTQPNSNPYRVFAINAFACQVRQIDQEGDFD